MPTGLSFIYKSEAKYRFCTTVTLLYILHDVTLT